jgi:hypothetical protein
MLFLCFSLSKNDCRPEAALRRRQAAQVRQRSPQQRRPRTRQRQNPDPAPFNIPWHMFLSLSLHIYYRFAPWATKRPTMLRTASQPPHRRPTALAQHRPRTRQRQNPDPAPFNIPWHMFLSLSLHIYYRFAPWATKRLTMLRATRQPPHRRPTALAQHRPRTRQRQNPDRAPFNIP